MKNRTWVVILIICFIVLVIACVPQSVQLKGMWEFIGYKAERVESIIEVDSTICFEDDGNGFYYQSNDSSTAKSFTYLLSNDHKLAIIIDGNSSVVEYSINPKTKRLALDGLEYKLISSEVDVVKNVEAEYPSTPTLMPTPTLTPTPTPTPTLIPTPTLTPTPTLAPTPAPISASIGDIIRFGKFEQDNNISNGKEEIQWVVLDCDGNRIFLLSKYILDSRVFQDNHPSRKMPSKAVAIKWADCTLRTWLNTEFIQEAFTPEEQKRLLKTHLETPKNQGISGGPDTDDKVFLLSIPEVTKYLSDAMLRGAVKTSYAKERSSESRAKLNWWWLRSPGLYVDCPAIVLDNGKYKEKFTNPENGYSGETTWIGRGAWYDIGVRPAMWIDITAFSDD